MPKNTASNELWSLVHAERAALAADLSGIGQEQWARDSLCGRWSVRQVLAHLTAAASTGPLRWIASALGSGLDFDLHNDRRLAEHLGNSPEETLARFRAALSSTVAPFGPVQAWLGEVLVHGQDIRRPLGLERDLPLDAATAVAGFYAAKDFTVPSRKNTAGLRLEASDGPFAAGEGPLVRGTTLGLVMAMAGRAAYFGELSGEGVETLRERCAGTGNR